MNNKESLLKLANILYEKNLIGIFQGSISKRAKDDKFLINKKDALFSEITKDDLIEIDIAKTLKWQEASIDAEIHANIYKKIPNAKFIAHIFSKNIVRFSLNNSFLIPRDFFGFMEFNQIKIYDPGQYIDWYERAPNEITNYLKKYKTNIIVIKGYGVYIYSRNIINLARKISILEKSAELMKD